MTQPLAKQPISVMLVEDNPAYREVIRLTIEDEPNMELAYRFGTAEMALQELRSQLGPKRPHVLLLDLRLPGRSGLESIPEFLDCHPEIKIIILTQSDTEHDVLRAISLGATGYLLKSTKVDEITDGIRDVMQGGAPIESQVARFLLKSLQSYLPKEDIEKALSERELEILTLLGEGLVKKEIAGRLAIGYSTVDTHVGNIYLKLDVRNAPEAISKAYRLGLLRPDH